ncbi:O-antigen ligase family protein, partial [Methylobacterium sp. WL103]
MLLNGTVLVVLWNHLWFHDLANRSTLAASEDGSGLTQVIFLGLGAAMAAALWRLGPAR